MHTNNGLGQILVGRGLVDETQLGEALEEEARTGTPLGRVLAARGLITENDLYEAQRELFSRTPAVVSGSDEPPAGGAALAPPPPPPMTAEAAAFDPVGAAPAQGPFVESEPLVVEKPHVEPDAVASDLEDPFGAGPVEGIEPAMVAPGMTSFDHEDLPLLEVEASAEAEETDESELKEPNLAEFLGAVIDKDGSDLHLTAGLPPTIRVDGELRPLRGYRTLTPQDLQEMIYSMLTQKQREQFEDEQELDLSYALPGRARFRVNVFQQRESLGSVMRLIPYEIKSVDGLGLPPAVSEFAKLRRGLVLVTGITGSGKSTTLAGLIDIVNRSRPEHIMTVEDPIEFLHSHKKSVVNQREVGTDTQSFASALKHVLRQDPDVILVGEMRDLETIQTALTAAETGHLVFGTLHTQDAPQSVDRIIDVFPPHQQEQIRVQLAGTLAGIVSQQLLPRSSGKGRAVAAEVLIATPAVRNLIREGKTHQIYTSMQAGGQYGMQVMDQHLAELVRKGTVAYEVALERCHKVEEFNRLVGKG